MEAQQQSAAAERKALEERLTKAQSEAEALRSQADRYGSAMQSRDMVIPPRKQTQALATIKLWALSKWLVGKFD